MSNRCTSALSVRGLAMTNPSGAQWKTAFRMMTNTSITAASGTGFRYHAFPASAGSEKIGTFVSEYTNPTSSSRGFGAVTMLTNTLTTMSMTNAAVAARNGTPCPGRSITPTLDRMKTKTAESVRATRPTQPAVAVIRLQNMATMNSVKSAIAIATTVAYRPARI